MVTRRIALVSETELVPLSDLVRVSAAVQKQVTDDFAPVWGIGATVDPFAAVADVPPGYWPVVVRDDIGLNIAGAHTADAQDKPFALVAFREDDWPLSVSHEVLEMLADPWGKEFVTGPSLLPGQGTVEYLAEVCDPCQGADSGYSVNGVVVADFVLPAYYKAFGAGRYSFAGNILAPREVLPGGYVSWRDPVTAVWTQFLASDGFSEFRDLGVDPAPPGIQLRGFIDRDTADYLAKQAAAPAKKKRAKPKVNKPTPATIRACYPAVREAEGRRWRRAIDRVVKPKA
jgi:hypothetical protein